MRIAVADRFVLESFGRRIDEFLLALRRTSAPAGRLSVLICPVVLRLFHIPSFLPVYNSSSQFTYAAATGTLYLLCSNV